MASIYWKSNAAFGNTANSEYTTLTAGTWGTDVLQDTAVKFTGRFSYKFIRTAVGNCAIERWNQTSNQPKIFAHARFQLSALPTSGTGYILTVRVTNGTTRSVDCRWSISPAGKMILRIGSTNVQTGTATIATATKYTAQLDVDQYGTNATVRVRLYNADGTTLLEELVATGQDITSALTNTSSIQFGFAGTATGVFPENTTLHMGDVIWAESAAVDPRTRVYVSIPNAAGADTGQTSGAFGDIDDMKDQAGTDTLTDYVEVTGTTARAGFTVDDGTLTGDAIPASANILSARMVYRYIRAGASNGAVVPFTRNSGGTYDEGASLSTSSSLATSHFRADDDAAGGAWTRASVLSHNFGWKSNSANASRLHALVVYVAAYPATGGPAAPTLSGQNISSTRNDLSWTQVF